ncbi:hypothetical protein D3C76_488690 [compost metagenome]
MIAGIEGGAARFRADGGREQQHFGAHQGQAASGFREPLIPADAHAEAAERGVPDFETGVAGAEVFLLLIADGVGDMRLAVHTQQTPVGICHAQRIEVGIAGLLVPAQRQHNAQFKGQR